MIPPKIRVEKEEYRAFGIFIWAVLGIIVLAILILASLSK
jgi:hypothetical protein